MKYAYANTNTVYKLKGYSKVVNGQILNCKMPIKAYKNGVEVATIDCGQDLLFNDILSTDGKVDVGTRKINLYGTLWRRLNTNDFCFDIYQDSQGNGVYTNGVYREQSKVICNKYPTSKMEYRGSIQDKTIAKTMPANNRQFAINDTSYATVEAFNAQWTANDYLDYALELHKEIDFTPVHLQDNLTFTDANGYEIEVVGKTMKVEKYSAVKKSKNLFDIEQPSLSSTSYVNICKNIQVKARYGSSNVNVMKTPNKYIFTRTSSASLLLDGKLVNCKPNTNYTFSFTCTNNSGGTLHFCRVYNLQNAIGQKKTITFTTDSNGEYAFDYFLYLPTVNQTCTIENIQLEEGSTATSYEPYGIIKYKATKI